MDEEGPVTLHQGRSSRVSAAKDAEGSDKELIEEGTVTLQIHHVLVKSPAREVTLRAVALYVPRIHDAVAGGTIV